MEETRNLCARISASLHRRICMEREKSGLNNNLYVSGLLEEYFTWKDNGGNVMAQSNGKTRTLAFQISEEFFQRIKTYLEKESKRLGRKVTQRDFVLGLIEQALDEAEREAARTEETAAGQSEGADARPEPGADSPNGEPDAGDAEEADSGENAENAPADAVEDADSADGLPTHRRGTERAVSGV